MTSFERIVIQTQLKSHQVETVELNFKR